MARLTCITAIARESSLEDVSADRRDRPIGEGGRDRFLDVGAEFRAETRLCYARQRLSESTTQSLRPPDVLFPYLDEVQVANETPGVNG